MKDFMNEQALSEGWDLFDVDGRLQLQRIDSPGDHARILKYSEPKFASDADALVFVRDAAARGSQYHQDALHWIGKRVED